MTPNRRALDKLHQLMAEDPIATGGHGPNPADGTDDIAGTTASADHTDGDAAEDDPDDGAEGSDERQSMLDAALSHVGLDSFSRETQELLLALTDDTAAVEPTSRQLFVDAASRGVQYYRNDSSALPRLLFLHRHHAHVSIETLAQTLGVPSDLLDAAERGEEPIDTLDPALVATWIHRFNIGVERARASLAQAIELQRRTDLAAAAAPRRASVTEDKFVQEVIALLKDRYRGSAE